jgi:hypothetical protein
MSLCRRECAPSVFRPESGSRASQPPVRWTAPSETAARPSAGSASSARRPPHEPCPAATSRRHGRRQGRSRRTPVASRTAPESRARRARYGAWRRRAAPAASARGCGATRRRSRPPGRRACGRSGCRLEAVGHERERQAVVLLRSDRGRLVGDHEDRHLKLVAPTYESGSPISNVLLPIQNRPGLRNQRVHVVGGPERRKVRVEAARVAFPVGEASSEIVIPAITLPIRYSAARTPGSQALTAAATASRSVLRL